MAGKLKDITNKRFGKLKVLSFAKRKDGKTHWKCKCDCGNIFNADANSLQQKTTTSCGCGRIKNLKGERFGKWTVLKFLYVKNRKAYWLCKCKCGNKRTISRSWLSCGTIFCSKCETRKHKYEDFTGKSFGNFVVVGNRRRIKNKMCWDCKCTCGKVVCVRVDHLKRGERISCGCARIRDITGMKSGYLTAICYLRTENTNAVWKCKCVCGGYAELGRGSLVRKAIKSCGCKKEELKRATCKKRYGVEYVTQNKEIMAKLARSQNFSYKVLHWKTRKYIYCRGSYELRVVQYFNKEKINFVWQPRSFDVFIGNKHKKYFPDLYLIGRKIWIEIKGYKRKPSMKKWRFFHKHIHKNSELWDQKKLKEMGIL